MPKLGHNPHYVKPYPHWLGENIYVFRFEKSLYDLIRGLRNHKGNESEYIQHSLRECRAEIKGADMGVVFLRARHVLDLSRLTPARS